MMNLLQNTAPGFPFNAMGNFMKIVTFCCWYMWQQFSFKFHEFNYFSIRFVHSSSADFRVVEGIIGSEVTWCWRMRMTNCTTQTYNREHLSLPHQSVDYGKLYGVWGWSDLDVRVWVYPHKACSSSAGAFYLFKAFIQLFMEPNNWKFIYTFLF
jgi:hypothetical protein